MFYLMGYRYAFSAASQYLGYGILRTFYLQNRGSPSKEVRQAAKSYFPEFSNMVKPIYKANELLKGTVEDNRLVLFRGSDGKPCSMGVFVSVNDDLFEVNIPVVPGDADTIAAYVSFLQNPKRVSGADVYHFNRKIGRCEFIGHGLECALP